MHDEAKMTLVIGVGGAGSAIVRRWSRTHADAELRFCIGAPAAAVLERAARVVVVVGLGGRSGGPRAILEVARAKARGAAATVLAIRPFSFEGAARQARACATLAALTIADVVFVFDNDDLLHGGEDRDLTEAYRACDEPLWELIVSQGSSGTQDQFPPASRPS